MGKPNLTKKQLDAIRRIADHGPLAWCRGMSRAGGAVGRMFDKLVADGYVVGPPYEPTDKGLAAIGRAPVA